MKRQTDRTLYIVFVAYEYSILTLYIVFVAYCALCTKQENIINHSQKRAKKHSKFNAFLSIDF